MDLAQTLLVIACLFTLAGVALMFVANWQLQGMFAHMGYYQPNLRMKLGVGNDSISPMQRRFLVFQFFTERQYLELNDKKLTRRARRTFILALASLADLLTGLLIGIAAYRQVVTV